MSCRPFVRRRPRTSGVIVCLLVVLAGGAAAWDCAVWTSEYAPTAWMIRSYVHWLDEPTAQVYAADRAGEAPAEGGAWQGAD